MAKYNIYEREGAVFRGKTGAGFVKEIWTSEGWMPYGGDPIAPVTFGDYLRSENDEAVPARGMGAAAEEASGPSKVGRSGRKLNGDRS